MASSLLEVDDLTVRYRTTTGPLTALSNVSFSISEGESLGIVGESGSGKSSLALALLGLLPPTAEVGGSVRFDGVELVGASDRKMNRYRGREIGLVYQDALVSLNPVRNVGSQIAEVVRRHRSELDRKAVRDAAIGMLERVGIPDAARRYRQFPHQFSGGMRQRTAIAMALAAGPRLLVADEVTTALDVTVQAQVLDLLVHLREQEQMAAIVISHDLDVVRSTSAQVLVMYAGRLVESGATGDVFTSPKHPYTDGLLRSAPSLERPVIDYIPGAAPIAGADLDGCAFADRCSVRRGRDRCVEIRPDFESVAGATRPRSAACHFSGETVTPRALQL